MMKKILSLLLLSTMFVSAQADDDFEKYRIGGYGEMLATFKDYGLNRFYGGSKGNTKKNPVDEGSVVPAPSR